MARKNRDKSRYLNITDPSPEPRTTPIAPIAMTDDVNLGRFRAVRQIATVVGQTGPAPKPLRKTKMVTNNGDLVKEAKKAPKNIMPIPINIAGQRVNRMGTTVISNLPTTSPVQ